MAKKQQVRKNSRASRRLVDEDPTLDLKPSKSAQDGLDAKSRVLQQLAERKLREGAETEQDSSMGIEDELTAISQGVHPDQITSNKSGTKASKSMKKNKRSKNKRDRAESIRDMLNEKIDLAKQRHRTIRNYRDDEEAEK